MLLIKSLIAGGIGALEKRFDAFSQHQQVTESSYNNSLADHYIWSTIKTLPATLPEPSSMDRDNGPGLLRAFLCQVWTLLKGWGLNWSGLAPRARGLLDCLAIRFIEEFPVVKSTSKTTLKKNSHISFIEFNWIASTRGVFKSHINEVI